MAQNHSFSSRPKLSCIIRPDGRTSTRLLPVRPATVSPRPLPPPHLPTRLLFSRDSSTRVVKPSASSRSPCAKQGMPLKRHVQPTAMVSSVSLNLPPLTLPWRMKSRSTHPTSRLPRRRRPLTGCLRDPAERPRPTLMAPSALRPSCGFPNVFHHGCSLTAPMLQISRQKIQAPNT